MAKKNSEYWRRRAEITENIKNVKAGKFTSEIEKEYNLALKTIQEDIEKWYGRFAKNNDITLQEARQWISGKDLAEFKWDVNEYIKHGKEVGINPTFITQLENASARFHISKLEVLKLKIQNSVEQLYELTVNKSSDLFTQIYTDSYYHTAYNLQQGINIGWDIAALNEKQLETALIKPWTLDKETFSDRIWTQKDKLLSEVHTQLSQNIILGKAPDEAIKAISQKFKTSKYNAGRLVMTESSYFANVAQKNAYEILDVEEFEIVGTLDNETCPVCGSLDGKHFPMSQYEVGVTTPPFHPWCRCVTAPYFDDNDGERIARDKDGKQYYVPSDMKYNDWKDKFVNDGDKSDLIEKNNDGIISWIENIPESPKKEYLTKKKLQEKITDIKNKLLNSIDDPDLIMEKEKYQKLLDEKLLNEQKKSLLKKQISLQSEFDSLDNKSYSGIWKDDVYLSDWESKKHSIESKKDYFTSKLNDSFLTDDEKIKWQTLLDDTIEYENYGKHYYEVKSKLITVQSNLTKLSKNDIINIGDPYSQERKDNALWAKSTKEADDALRDVCGDVWRNATDNEKHAIYEYTHTYKKYNEPLRGYEYGTNKYLGVGNVDLEEIGVDYRGYERGEVKKLIDDMSAIIDKSHYDIDVWVQRGVDYGGMDKFFGIDSSDFYLSENELAAKLLNTKPIEYGFLSTGVSKGKGFSHKSIIMNVYAPSGTKMMYAEPFSEYGNGAKLNWDGISKQNAFGDESEMIFQRGTKFKVTKVEKTHSKIYIDLEVIEQG